MSTVMRPAGTGIQLFVLCGSLCRSVAQMKRTR